MYSNFHKILNQFLTRMHSSRMRTVRSLTASHGGGGGCAWQGACMAGGMHGGGVHGRGHVWLGACVAGGHAWWRGGGCMVGDVHGRGHVWQGACIAGVHAWGSAWHSLPL